ncbi:translation initiation factor IF-2 [Lachnoclostridium sp. Marseille-P6806]|uniref:translation initiation factor IF-2 n=1 Tax=Lachnoclostridium sp. Marseille-P6806 TaxID=2364793 RepID=UPI00102F3F22|nr:translation initiation factor IF-2 [Lachnoclostridium sp. Marseille-P6806]
MAKTKISELASQYHAERKDILNFLKENGVEVKTASSSVDDDAVAMVAKKFGSAKQTAPVKEELPEESAPAAKPETQEQKSAPAEGKTAAGDAAARPAAAAAKQTVPDAGAAPVPVKKKKKIIIVTNNSSGVRRGPAQGMGSGQGGQRRSGGRQGAPMNGGRGSAGGSRNSFVQPVHRIIKPKTVPSQMEIDYHKPEQPRREHTAGAEESAAQEMKRQENTVQAAEQQQTPAAQETTAQTPVSQAQTGEGQTPSRGTSAAPAETSPRAEERRSPAPERRNPARRGQNADGQSRSGVAGRTQGEAPRSWPPRRSDGSFIISTPAPRTGGYGNNNNRGGQGGYGGNRGGQGGYGSGRTGGPGARPGQGYGGNRGGQGGYGSGRPGAGGPGGSFDRSRRAPGGRPAPAAGGDSFVKDAEKHRDENRRKQGQERDKRSRREYLYNDGNSAQSKKPGRFIKPERKIEEVQEEQIKTISVPDKITVHDLAEKMRMRDADIIKNLFLKGQITTPNTELSYEEVEKLVIDYDILCEKEEQVDVIEELLREEEDSPETMEDRAPVVCVMGHVDHGKTTLLDYIRAYSMGITDEDKRERERKMKALSVADKEAGGITQAIGAYQVEIDGKKITFLDTPGHEAFTAMRMRGAKSTDIAILVVAADDGVMPQTVEAINHAKAAGIEIIVAVNKIDKPEADVNRVKQELTEYELVATDWGGTTEFVPVSARSGQGVTDLLETILLTSDILELKANPDRKARGLVLEARLDKGRGPVANVLVQKGTLCVGDFISAGAASGKVRAMVDDRGRSIRAAGPSMPVEVLGLSEAPSAGEVILAHDDDRTAKQYATTYRNQHKENLLEETKMKMSLDDLFTQMKEGNLKEFDVIIKADVQGSVEALKTSLMKLSNDEVVVKCIHGGVGAINESDISLAAASNAVIIGFNVRPDPMAKSLAEHEGVDVRLYKVIYEAINEVEAAMRGMEAPVYEEQVIGHAEIRQIFKASQVGNIAGSTVVDGVIRRGCKVRITRGRDQIFDGDLKSLKRFKDDVKEVKGGYECGLVFDGFDEIQVDDRVEAYEMVQVIGERAAQIKAERRAKAKAEAEKASAENK